MNELTIRRQLAEARIALRLAQDVFTLVQAQAAQRITETAGGAKALGNNSEERERALTVQLAADDECMTAQGTVRHYQAAVDRLQATLDDEIDQRRREERASRERLATAMETLSMHTGVHGGVLTILATPQVA